MPSIQCKCGEQIVVREVQAGDSIKCTCGAELIVPRLSVLRSCIEQGEPAPADTATEQSTSPDDTERDVTILLTTSFSLNQRISHEALVNFTSACERVVSRNLAPLEQTQGFDIQFACAVLPNNKTLVDIQLCPDILPEEFVHDLASELENLPRPVVSGGPVAFATRRMIAGGCNANPRFGVPFAKSFRREGTIDELLMQAGGASWMETSDFNATADKPSFWMRLKRLLCPSTRNTLSQAALSQSQVGEEVGSHSVTEQWLGDLSIEQLKRFIDEHPHETVLHGRLGDFYMERGQLDQAIAAYSDALRIDASSGDAYRARGRANCLAGSMQQGLADYSAAIELNPTDADSLAQRACIFMQLEAPSRAEADLSAAISHNSREPSLFVERARARYAQQNIEQTLEDLEAALRLDPHHEMAYALRGITRQQKHEATTQDVEESVQDFSRAVEIRPENPVHYAHRAEAHTRQGKHSLAIEDCNRSISFDDKCALAYAVRGYARQQLEDYEDAITDCSEAIALGLESPIVHISRSIAYQIQGETELAIDDCDAALAIDPEYAVAFHHRGTLRMVQGELESATEDFAAADRLEPKWATPYEHRGNVHRMQEELKLAVEDYTKAIELEPTDVSAHANRALTWIDLEQYEKALDDLDEALRIDPEFVPGYFHRAEVLLTQEESERALADLERAISLQPDYAAAIYTRAQVLLHLGKSEDALQDYNTLIQLDPTVPAAYIGRANAWVRLGEQQRASDDYREAVQLDPGSAEQLSIHRLLVEAHHLHGEEEYERAITRATEAIERDPSCSTAYARRAGSYWYSEQWVEAVEDYTRLLEMCPDSSHAYNGRGHVYAEMGEYDAAMADLDKAVNTYRREKSKTGLAYALCGRGLAHAGLLRFDEAERNFEESVELCPENAWVHYSRGLMYLRQDRIAPAKESFQQAVGSVSPPLTKRKRERAVAILESS